ncbi:MAG: hypothetical protein ACOX3J_01745 [Clostridia bacterium]|jgi:hypothetical protein
MKRRLLSLILTAVMLLSAMAGFSGCGKSGFGSTTVVTNKETKIGNLKKDGWSLTIPKNCFDEDVKVNVTKVGSGEAYDAAKDSFLALPIDISIEGMENVRLNEPVKITMKLNKKNLPDAESFDRTVMTYWNGGEWEPIIPDPVRLSEGYLEFETWHFSSYGGKLMNREEQIKLYAQKMAVENWSNENEDPTYIEKVKAVCNDYFDGIGLYASEMREIIIDRVLDMNIVPTTRELAAEADMQALAYKCGELLAEATIEMVQENPLVKESLMVGLGNIGTLIEGTEALNNGDYKTALVEFTDLGVSLMGYGTGVGTLKSVADLGIAATEQGIMAWKDYELECAYKAYAGLAKKGAYGYTLNSGDWETLTIQMRGYYNRLLSEKKEAYRKLHGKSKLTDDEVRTLETQVDAELRKQFDARLANEKQIAQKAAEYEKIIQTFKDVNLLNRLEYGYKYEMTVEQRLRSLFTIRQVILKMVGGDISVFGSEKDREVNLSIAIAKWLSCGKDRAKFYDWMREKGYLKKAGEATEGYWKLVRSFENEYEQSAADENYLSSWSGGGGSYSYNCKFIGHHWYTASTHDDCHGEFVNNSGTASSPKDSYLGGEKVTIDLKISAETSPNICFHLGASLGASITPVNHDDPFVSYGTNMDLWEVVENPQKSRVSTNKNDTNTGYVGGELTVGGEMPSGSANGDKVYILISMSGGNNLVTTAYEYEWHMS